MTDNAPYGAWMAEELDNIRPDLSPEMQESYDRLIAGLSDVADSFLAMEVGLLSGFHDRWLVQRKPS